MLGQQSNREFDQKVNTEYNMISNILNVLHHLSPSLPLESLSASKSEQEGHVSPTSWDSNWGTFDKPKSAGDSMASPSRQEVLQNKREERRLKQQAAREKRAAGVKPGGLGAVKKD